MHIAYITTEFVTEQNKGGLATYLYNITGIMSRNGHDVTVITLSDRNDEIQFDSHICVVRVKGMPAEYKGSSLDICRTMIQNSYKLYRALKKQHRKYKVDIIQSVSLQAVGFFRSYRIPTVVRVSSDTALWRNAAQFNFDYNSSLKEKRLEDYLELWCVKKADYAYAPSRFCAEVIGKRAGRHMDVIESPYQSSECDDDDSLYREMLYQKKYLLFNSSLSRIKGTHIGIQATEKLLNKYPDLYMVYAGSDLGLAQKNNNTQSVGEILRRLSRKYNGRVIYLGMLEHEKLFPLVRNAAACVLPSRVDNLPNSCIEAMALGSIVIGTYGASFEQLITNKENGLLIKRDSYKSLINAVDYLMNLSDAERQMMKEKATATVDRLQPQKVYEQVIAFYKNAIEKF